MAMHRRRCGSTTTGRCTERTPAVGAATASVTWRCCGRSSDEPGGGINLAGVRRIIELEQVITNCGQRIAELEQLADAYQRIAEFEALPPSHAVISSPPRGPRRRWCAATPDRRLNTRKQGGAYWGSCPASASPRAGADCGQAPRTIRGGQQIGPPTLGCCGPTFAAARRLPAPPGRRVSSRRRGCARKLGAMAPPQDVEAEQPPGRARAVQR